MKQGRLAQYLKEAESLSIVDDSIWLAPAQVIDHIREVMRSVHERWRIPIQEEKWRDEGTPSHKVCWAGIDVDLRKDTMSLPERKREAYSAAITHLLDQRGGGKMRAPKKLLESVLGKLSFAAQVYPMAAARLYRMRHALAKAKDSPYVYLNSPQLRSEMEYWVEMFRHKSPETPALTMGNTRPGIRFIMDASTDVAMAGCWLEGREVRFWHHPYTELEKRLIRTNTAQKNPDLAELRITQLELACYNVCLTLGDLPSYGHIQFVSDNQPSVYMISNMRTRVDAIAADMVQEIAEKLVEIGATTEAIWIPSHANFIADKLSRLPDTNRCVNFLKETFPGRTVKNIAVDTSPLEAWVRRLQTSY